MKKILALICSILLCAWVPSCNKLPNGMGEPQKIDTMHHYTVTTREFTHYNPDKSISISIKAPQLDGIDDDPILELNINWLLNNEAMKELTGFSSLDSISDIEVTVDYEIEFLSQNVIGVAYHYYSFEKWQAYPLNRVKTLMIDLTRAKKIMLEDYITVNEDLISLISGHDFVNYHSGLTYEDDVVQSVREYISKYLTTDALKDGDNEYYTEVQLVLTSDSWKVIMAVSKGLGENIVINIPFEDLTKYLKSDNNIFAQ